MAANKDHNTSPDKSEIGLRASSSSDLVEDIARIAIPIAKELVDQMNAEKGATKKKIIELATENNLLRQQLQQPRDDNKAQIEQLLAANEDLTKLNDTLREENKQLKAQIAALEDRVSALEQADNQISLGEVARVFESACVLRFCRDHFTPILTSQNDSKPQKQRVDGHTIANQAKNLAKNEYYNFAEIKGDSNLQPHFVTWARVNGVTNEVFGLIRRLKNLGDGATHLRPNLAPAELEVMLQDDEDSEDQQRVKSTFVALLTGFLGITKQDSPNLTDPPNPYEKKAPIS